VRLRVRIHALERVRTRVDASVRGSVGSVGDSRLHVCACGPRSERVHVLPVDAVRAAGVQLDHPTRALRTVATAASACCNFRKRMLQD
jgi:hypothetical protein